MLALRHMSECCWILIRTVPWQIFPLIHKTVKIREGFLFPWCKQFSPALVHLFPLHSSRSNVNTQHSEARPPEAFFIRLWANLRGNGSHWLWIIRSPRLCSTDFDKNVMFEEALCQTTAVCQSGLSCGILQALWEGLHSGACQRKSRRAHSSLFLFLILHFISQLRWCSLHSNPSLRGLCISLTAQTESPSSGLAAGSLSYRHLRVQEMYIYRQWYGF